jgi:hypothetical protein
MIYKRLAYRKNGWATGAARGGVDARGYLIVSVFMYGRSTVGTLMLPSSCW